MTITVNIDMTFEFSVKQSVDEVFDVLADTPLSVSYFPKMDKLMDLGDGVYRWEMEKLGIAGITLQTIYASKYVVDKANHTVVWTPVKGEGNSEVAGSWTVTETTGATKVVLVNHGLLNLPLPALVRVPVSAMVRSEFSTMVEQFIANLTERFGGKA